MGWLAFGVAVAVLYAPVVAKLSADWWNDPDYSHGLLCAPLAIAVAFSRGRALAALARSPRSEALAGAAAGIVLLFAGTLGAELFLTRASLLVVLASAVVYLYGWRHLRALAFPFALLACSIPIPAIVITRITLPLQYIASATTEASLDLMNIPVLREGNVLILPNAALQVAEACSGIRSLVSLVVLALIVARFAESRTSARFAIVASAAPIAVVVNSLRVTATALATYQYGPSAAEGAAHEATGVLMFVVAVGLVMLFARGVIAIRRDVALRPAA